MNQIKLIIFDLDGTVADTMDGIVEAVRRTVTELGYPPHTRESVLGFVNYGVRTFVELMLPEDRRTDPAAVDEAMRIYLDHYAETYPMTVPYAGVPDLLERLSGRVLLAMNSNKQDEFVKALAGRLFREDTFLCAEGFLSGRPGKPDPAMAFEIMRRASDRLGQPLTPDMCVYVGDSDIDVLTARAAGMHPVSVSWGYRSWNFLHSLGDQPIARTVDELEHILCGMGI